MDDGEVLSISSPSAPINKMLAVAGKLWCACGYEIVVLNPSSLEVEVRSFFTVMHEVVRKYW